MLPARRRLSAREVRDVIKKGRAARGLFLSVKHLAGSNSLRSAAVVSKAVARSAVARNRARRALYRALASPSAPLPGGSAVFFVQRIPPSPLTLAFVEDIALLLKKLNTRHV